MSNVNNNTGIEEEMVDPLVSDNELRMSSDLSNHVNLASTKQYFIELSVYGSTVAVYFVCKIQMMLLGR